MTRNKKEKRASVTQPQHPSIITSWNNSLGASIHPDTAMGISAVYACVRVIAESIASLPLKVYRQNGRKKEVAYDHPLYKVLHNQSNSDLTAFELREMLVTDVLLRGNAYCEIEMNQRGDVIGLWRIHPDRVRIYRNDPTVEGPFFGYTGLLYVINVASGGTVTLPASKIWHIKGPTQDGIYGQSPLTVSRSAFNTAMATDDLAQSVFENGTNPGGVIETPKTLSDEGYKNLVKSWEGRHQGAKNASKVAVLEEGMSYKPLSLNMQDVQFLETRKFQKNEIATIFRVPPHMIGDLDKATFSNIEHQSLEFVTNTLRPWLERIEQSAERDLLGTIEKNVLFIEFNVDALLRGDQKSRYDAYHTAKLDGWLSTNEIRSLENLDPIEGGDVYWMPLQMGNAASLGAPQQPQAPQQARTWVKGFTVATRDALERVLRRELNDVGRKSSVDMTRFSKDHTDFVKRSLAPVVQTTLAFIGNDSSELAQKMDEYLAKSAQRRLKIISESTIGEDWIEAQLANAINDEITLFESIVLA